MCQISINFEHFQYWDKFGPNSDKYFIKIIFDIKDRDGIFERSDFPNFNKF